MPRSTILRPDNARSIYGFLTNLYFYMFSVFSSTAPEKLPWPLQHIKIYQVICWTVNPLPKEA